jgi:hypothetical protein
MSRHLPSHPSLEHLRKQAKDRLPDLRARNREARLADAQHAIAGRSSHGYMIAAQWLDSRALEAVISKAGQPVSRVRYAVSTDGTTLTLSSTAAAHDGYPAVDDVRVFVRA